MTSFVHEALFYGDPSEQLDTVTEFVRAGLESGDRVVVILDEVKIDSLRKRLGPSSESVQFVATSGAGGNPARLIPVWMTVVESLEPGQCCRGVAEPVRSGMADEQIAETQLNEFLLNMVFEDAPSFWLLCTFDNSLLDEANLNEVCHSHRYVATGSQPTKANEEYESGEGQFHRQRDFVDAPGDAERFEVDTASVGIARKALFDFAHAIGMTDSVAADCALAGHEVIANSLRHGDGKAHLSIWREHETLVCEVRDAGQFSDPLAGRTKPSPRGRSGRGLWIANQLCDLVQIRSEPQGTVVRLHMSRSQPGP